MRAVVPRNGSTGRIAALEDLPATPAAPLEVPVTGYAVQLDPARTAAYALVGVFIDNTTGTPVILRPGDVYRVARPFRRIYVFNAQGWLASHATANSRPAGRVTFLIAEEPAEVIAPAPGALAFQRAAGHVYTGLLPASGGAPGPANFNNLGWLNDTPVIPLSGVRKLRVTLAPYAVGQVGVIPADFAAAVRPWVLTKLTPAASDGTVVNQPCTLEQLPAWDDPLAVWGSFLFWAPHGAGDVNASASDMVAEFDVPSGLAVSFERLALAGTNVTGLIINVEAY